LKYHRAFNSGFKLALMTKDVGIAAELARGLKLKTGTEPEIVKAPSRN
jgi:3-hydroxyisobutyrate dehydrogenase-like beta-hydroxyacid dehydrogenase